MKRGGPIERRTPLRKRNARRARKLLAEQYGGEYADWICRHRCVVCEKHGLIQTTPTVPAHCAKTRGAGGTAEHMAPLCAWHEDRWHRIGRTTFARRYRVRLRSIARQMRERWLGHNGCWVTTGERRTKGGNVSETKAETWPRVVERFVADAAAAFSLSLMNADPAQWERARAEAVAAIVGSMRLTAGDVEAIRGAARGYKSGDFLGRAGYAQGEALDLIADKIEEIVRGSTQGER